MTLRLRDYTLLALVCAALYLPGLATVPPIDRDEPRFAESAREMLASHDFVDIRFQDEPRLKKPVGIYWLQAASAKIFASGPDDRRIWPYRVPSTVAAISAVLLTATIGAAFFGRMTGLGAGILLALSLLLNIEARLAKTDATLLAFTCLVQLCLARAYLARDNGAPADGAPRAAAGRVNAAIYWLAIGGGILIKGPIIVMVTGLTALTLVLVDRNARWLKRLRPWPYFLLTLIIVLPWGIAIMIGTKGAFFEEAVGHDLVGKITGAQESHGLFPGFFLVTFWATFWPGSLLAGLALPWVWRHWHTAQVRFSLAWLVPSWIVFEAVPTKLPHYTLPLFPAIAILAARAALDPWPTYSGARARLAQHLFVGAWILLSAGMCVALPLIPAAVDHRIDGLALALAAVALLLFLAALRLYRQGRRVPALATLVAACLLYSGTAYDWVLPRTAAIWVSSQVAAAVARAAPCPTAELISAGYSEPSLVFLIGPKVAFGDGGDAGRTLAHNKCALALVDKPFFPAFAAALEQAGAHAEPVATIDGLNLARGKRVALTLYARARADGGS
jgi:4-amino-4-deoxy-L-arabinose transferase-like glycosyltransferase